MPRIIFEDMKINRAKKIIPLPREKTTVVLDLNPKRKDKIIKEDIAEKQDKIEKKKEIIYPEEKEDINDVKIEEYIKERTSNKRIGRTPRIKNKVKLFRSSTIFTIVLIFFIIGFYGLGKIFEKANISISAKHQSVSYKNKPFLASKNINDKAINFEIMITGDKKDKNIILTEPKDVSIKASGSITLYNEFSAKDQNIITGAYMLDNEGKTYRTDKAITIPGYKLDANKKILPGKVEVGVTSFLPGEAYNGKPSDFKFNNFKGTTKYNKIYGKLSSPIEGGALGIVYSLDDTNKAELEKFIQTSFRDDLLRQVKAQVPSGYILYNDASTFTYKIGSEVLSKTPETIIPIEGILAVVLLKEKDLTESVVKVSFPDISEPELKEITIPDLNNLSFSFLSKDQLITKDMDSVYFSLSGEVEAIWKPELGELKNKLMGVKKDKVLSIFQQDPGIAQASVSIFPPWQKYISSNLSKINIILK